MFSNRVFQITFLVSLITHGVIMFQNPNLNLFPANKKEQKIEVSYLKNLQKQEEPLKTITPKKEPLLELPQKITAQKKIPPPFIDKDALFKQNKEITLRGPLLSKPALLKPEIRPDIIAIKKKITLPPIGIDKINNASYISYYQIVREKIKRAAYQNYTRTETGEVYLSFIILSNGNLKDVKLNEERSASSAYLKETALSSIKDASAFPVFPKELDYPELSFNVIISFEIE